jgi:tRNA-modifying protein YgfZ
MTGRGPAPRNYGDPAAEYEAARRDLAVAERQERRFLRVHGRDPVRMVQGLVTNDVAGMPADGAVYAAVLTPKGRMIADVRIIGRGAELLLETDAAALEPLTTHFRKYVPPLFARFDDVSEQWACFTVLGPRAAAALDEVLGTHFSTGPGTGLTALDAGPDADAAPGSGPGPAALAADVRHEADVVHEAELDSAGIIVVTTSYVDVPAFDLLIPAAAADSVWQALTAIGARPLGHATLDVLRIEAGTPKWGAELDETRIPLEAGLRERAISERKGCYTGQEVIIRILHRGHVNWLLRGVLLGDAATPSPGAALLNEAGKKVGRITSSAWSPRHGQTIALGYIRREVEPGTELQLEDDATGARPRVVALPFTERA